MDPIQIVRFTESLERCLERETFLDRFYEEFMAASPEIADRFRDTDFDKQKRALSASLYLLVMAIDGGEAATAYLETVARKHSRGELDIRPELYDIWLEVLIRIARDHDSSFDDAIEEAWRTTMQFGIDFMVERY